MDNDIEEIVSRTRDRLYETVSKIADEDIKGFVYHALDDAPQRFWYDPCSSSGKYHPPEDQGPGGMIRHLLKCTEITDELSRFYDLPEKDRDVTLAGTILHDIKKNGDPWGERTDYEHGKIAYEWLGQFDLKNPEKEHIRNCVRYHMGRWVQPEKEVARALDATTNERIVQLSDYFGSRKAASFLPGLEISEEQIREYLK